MKFLWQQLLGIFIIILVAFTTSAVTLSDYMTHQVLSETEQKLLSYGQNVVDNGFSRADINRADQLLSNENINIRVYLSDGKVIYPTYREEYKAVLSDEELLLLAQGQTLPLRTTPLVLNTGESVQLATVYLPLTSMESGFPEGFISLSEPINNLQQKQESVSDRIYLSFGFAAAVAFVLTVIYSLYQTNKIKRLQLATKEIASGQYEIELNTKGHDEFAELARDFQVMSDALLVSQEEIERQELLRRQFMMDVAHEMRTPLTTMNGVLEGLQYDLIPEEAKERSIVLVSKETQRLIRLVNENLDYEKIRNKQIVLKKQQLNLKNIFYQIADQLMAKANEKGNRFIVVANSDVQVYADPDRLVQILMNLANNAIQFSENSVIELIGSMTDTHTVMTVKDHGIGINPEDIRSIWERFYKVDVSRKNTKFGESGIGLAVVQSLVEAHDGMIAVDSKPNEGTEFTMTLPIIPHDH